MIAYEIKPNSFCNGVKRAIKMINDCINNPNTKKPIYMFGYVVHNKNVMEAYLDKLIVFKDNYLENLNRIKNGTVIFTAHGISKNILELAKLKGLDIVDTTCPKVTLIQNKILKQLDNGFNIKIIGEKNHPEVISYLSLSDKVSVYDKNDTILDNTFFINQTTLIYYQVLDIYNNINKQNKNILINEEVCDATKQRQNALKQTFGLYDGYLIIGDKLSNNTNSLYEIAKEYTNNSYKIETINDLNDINLTNINKIGVISGASTPKAITDEIIDCINNKREYKSNLNKNDYLI